MKKFEVVDASGSAEPTIKVGDVVYECSGYDYGCASDDTRMTGVYHVSVTRDPEGGYPFFTIPQRNLKEVVYH